jgi:hypothetical protein
VAALLARATGLHFPKDLSVIALFGEVLAASLSAIVLFSVMWFAAGFVDCFSSCSPPAPSQYLGPAFLTFMVTGTSAAAAFTVSLVARGKADRSDLEVTHAGSHDGGTE